MNDFDKWAEGWNDGMLNDPDDSVRVARAAAHAAWLEGRDAARDDLIQCLLATRGQSEGTTADAILSMLTAAQHPAEQQPELAKYQPCGCVICTCEHETQCQGCGAHHCGTHPVGQIPNPAYQQVDRQALAKIHASRAADDLHARNRLLVEALERVMYCNEVKFLPEGVQQAVSDALAAHRKQQENK